MVNINTNLSSLIVQNNLNSSTNSLNKAIERLSTGFKINHAADNAAGYSIVRNMTGQISSYEVAEENAGMGLDLLQTASDNLDLITRHLSRIRDLAEQASNGTYGQDSLNAIQAEADSRMAEINRIIANTEYNGISLLGGVDPNGVTGSFLAPVEQLTEEEAISQGYTIIKTKEDLENIKNNMHGKYILMNDIDLNNSCLSYSTGDWSDLFGGELNGNGHVIKNLKAVNSEGYAGLFASSMHSTFKNLGLENVDISGEDAGVLWGTGPFNTVTNVYVTGKVHGIYYAGGIFGAGEEDTLTNCYADCIVTCDNSSYCGAIVGCGDKESFNTVYYNSAKTPNSIGPSSSGTPAATGLTASELDALLIKPSGGDSVIQFQVGINGDSSSQISVNTGFIFNLSIDLTSNASARSALSAIDSQLSSISAKQTEIGAAQNRLDSVLESISVAYENLVSSRSTLRDADVAKVSSDYIKNQILQQASATLLATANQTPSIALQLL